MGLLKSTDEKTAYRKLWLAGDYYIKAGSHRAAHFMLPKH